MYCLIVINERMLIEYFQGERILKLAEMCRKLETEEEKVLPFYASSLTEQEQADVAAVVQEPPTQPLSEVTTALKLILCTI